MAFNTVNPRKSLSDQATQPKATPGEKINRHQQINNDPTVGTAKIHHRDVITI